MKPRQNKTTETPVSQPQALPAAEHAQYAPPQMYVIGRSRDLLQGSGRHKNDDTGSRGFVVDQR